MTFSPIDAERAAEHFAAIEAGVVEACRAARRSRADVTLLAVSKEQPLARIEALHALGLRDFGENKVQALAGRLLDLQAYADIRWHMIGALQTNKARDIARLRPALVHTVDREALVEALETRWIWPEPLDVCLQVNVDDEPQKAGCSPAALDALADRVARSPKLRLKGLMAIPAPQGGESLRHAFARLRELSLTVADRIGGPAELSMGMSDDYPLAILEGATIIRIGTALFGPRT